MATYDELSKFTYGELSRMRLTNGDLCNKSLQELLEIAQEKVERFQSFSEEKQGVWSKVSPLLQAIIVGVSANLTTDLIKSVDWKNLLIETLKFLDKIMPQ